MPRYEIRNTSNNTLAYVDGNLPLNLMLSQAAGTYRARVMSDEQATDIVVPSLTASITQTSLTVGQTATLNTNAPNGSTFQWRLNGTDIAGATGTVGTDPLTRVTANPGTLTARVSIPGNPQPPVTSAGVTVSAASSLSRIMTQGEYRTTIGNPTFTINTSALQAGDRLIMAFTYPGNVDPSGVTVAGASAGTHVAKHGTQFGGRTLWWYEYVMPGAGAANTAIAFTVAGSDNQWGLIAFGVRGGQFAASVGPDSTGGAVASAVITPPSVPNLLLAAHFRLNSFPDHSWTNATDVALGIAQMRAGFVTDAAANVARTITGTSTTAGNNALTVARIAPL